MCKLCQIQIKVHENIFLCSCVRDSDLRNGNELLDGFTMDFLNFLLRPADNFRNGIFTKSLGIVFLFGDGRNSLFSDFFDFFGCNSVFRCVLNGLINLMPDIRMNCLNCRVGLLGTVNTCGFIGRIKNLIRFSNWK